MSFDDYLKFGGYPGSYVFKDKPEEFVSYLKTSIISSVIDKDILNNHAVKMPSLFKQAFELIMAYPAQEVSYTKLLGQLQDKGNTDLVKYYLSLYEGAFLIKSISKYSSKEIKRRTSSPKLIPLCPAFYYLTIQDDYRPDERGRVFELVVGAALNRLHGELYYWREKDKEVDFVLTRGRKVFAIEVKSGRRKNEKGLEAFCKKFPEAKPIFITPENFERIDELIK
jgi:predicted AAA+ superfamily ATPase